MSYRSNPSNDSQTKIENADFEGQSPVFVSGETKEIVVSGGGTAHVNSANGASPVNGKTAGTIMGFKDWPGVFLGDTIGRG